MYDEGSAKVSSGELMTLQSDLINLSNQLHDLYELMNTDVSGLGEYWRDSKYEEFLQGYKPQMDKMDEISERYREWATKDLQVTIDNVIDTEGVDVSGSNVGSGSFSSGGGSESSSSSSQNAVKSKAELFREGIIRTNKSTSGDQNKDKKIKFPPKPDDSGADPDFGRSRSMSNGNSNNDKQKQLLNWLLNGNRSR